MQFNPLLECLRRKDARTTSHFEATSTTKVTARPASIASINSSERHACVMSQICVDAGRGGREDVAGVARSA